MKKILLFIILIMISYNTIGQDRMIMDDVLIDTDLTKYINNLRKYVGLVELPFGTDSYEISDYLNRNDLYNLKDMKEKTVKKLDLDRENVLHNVTIFQEYRSIFEFDIRTFY